MGRGSRREGKGRGHHREGKGEGRRDGEGAPLGGEEKGASPGREGRGEGRWDGEGREGAQPLNFFAECPNLGTWQSAAPLNPSGPASPLPLSHSLTAARPDRLAPPPRTTGAAGPPPWPARARVCPPRLVVRRPAPPSPAAGPASAPLRRRGPSTLLDLHRGRPTPGSALPGRWCAAPPRRRETSTAAGPAPAALRR
ncbi:oleosin-B6-like [Miscanthus floridulus]|uniref:oleosin-B6-like n=1 Tax=Miscanthus floridulus TaxID=154761 RepID=UPI003458FEEF